LILPAYVYLIYSIKREYVTVGSDCEDKWSIA
jgi:hypothetical protein